METKQQKTSVLMLPWLAHGHVSPYLELAKKLSQKKFHIYFCSTSINLKPIRENFKANIFSSIQFIDLPLPSSPELPPQYHTTKDLPPHLIPTLITAFDAAKPAFSKILKTIKPNLVIYDFLQPWVPIAANEQKIQAILFLTCGAPAASFLSLYSKNPSMELPFKELKFSKTEHQNITQFLNDTVNGIVNKDRCLACTKGSSNMVLIKSSREIEAKYIDYISSILGKEIVPVGPLIQEPANKEEDAVIMEWLSKKDPFSVVYISFGSENYLSKEEMEEIALGLELSKVSFIWVVKFHAGDKISIHESLPQEFAKTVEERGLIVEGWAPQAKILGHSSVGGFVSHCGWNSIVEGIMFGVPIIAMPIHLDQPLSAKFVVEIGVGMEVPRENERIKKEEVARVINEVVVQEEGKKLRNKAKELSERMRKKEDQEIDEVVDKMQRLVKESSSSAASNEI